MNRSMCTFRTVRWTLAASLAVVLTIAAVALAQQPDGPAQLSTRSDADLGTYLVDGEGMALYAFVDTSMDRGPDRVTSGVREASPSCTDACARAWPPLLTEGAAEATGQIDEDLLGTTERPDGSSQVVYNGWPLYLFASDRVPGDVSGQAIAPPDAQAFGATWYLVSPDGSLIVAEPTPTDDAEDGDGDDDGGDDGGGGYY